MSRSSIKIAAAALAMTVAPAAQAAVVFADNFDGYDLQLNATSLGAKWTVAGPGDVDIIGQGTGPLAVYDFLPGNGRYVDLGGSNGKLGTLQTVQSFAAGNYVLKFSLAGTQRVAADTTTISLGNWSRQIALRSDAGFTSYTFNVDTDGGILRFGETVQLAPSFYSAEDLANTGNLLDNVELSTAVPEPATWMMMMAGFAFIGAGMRRRSLLSGARFA